MMTPKLDSRSIDDILAEIKRKSEFYTPEWRFDPKNPDGGAALAQLFSEMFFDTLDRYNRFPDKCYLEFLNMLGVCAKSVSPAVGMAKANMVDGANQSVFIKRGTQLFTDISSESGDTRVVFETVSGYYATPSELQAIIMTNPNDDIITMTEISDEDAFPLALFGPPAERNLEKHCFSVAHAGVLRLNGSAEIRLKVTNSATSYLNSQIISQLCDQNFAKWSYVGKSGRVDLMAQARPDCIALLKDSREPVEYTDEEGSTENDGELLPRIFCEMNTKGGTVEITADAIEINSASTDDELHHGILPDRLFANDTELSAEKCGYCFGKEPNVYDSFYISCGEAFSKGSAVITAELTINTVVFQDNRLTDSEEIDFNSKLVVDKDDAQVKQYDDVFISEIIWEYWNGYGWARLEVTGDINPFSCEEQSANKIVRFTCPDDFAPSMQNAYEGLWIRARVREVENRYSTRARWLLPHLKNMVLHFDYGSTFLPADVVSTLNSCCRRSYSMGTTRTMMQLFRLMPEQHYALYFLFDTPPEGYPVNFYMDFAGNSDGDRVISFQYLSGSGDRTVWSELKAADHTGSFGHSGIVSLYCPKDFCEAELFGRRGYWIRAVNRSMDFAPDQSNIPQLSGIVKNAVEIIQKQSVRDEHKEVFAGKAGQSFVLSGSPVIGCELWIDELAETPVSELRELKERDPRRVRMVTDSDGQLTECWVCWEARDTLVNSGAKDRHYELDSSTGKVSFGDGVNGKIPAYIGTAQVSVDYSFGGGTSGNLPTGAIDGLIVGIPFVDSMTNFRPTCGGSSGQSIETIRRIGTKRLGHLGRAVTAEDFESLILEEFTEVAEVRCFSNRNAQEEQENGCVTVVVMPHDYTDEVYSTALCRRIYDFLEHRAGVGLVAAGRLSVIPASVMRVSSEITIQTDDFEYAAETEQNAAAAVNQLLTSSPQGGKIGFMPRTADFIAALKRVEHISYVSGIMLIGEYYRGSRKITVPLDDGEQYRYFVAASGTHTIKL